MTFTTGNTREEKPLYGSNRYALYADHVQEGPHTARAFSRSEIHSEYPAGADHPGVWKLQHDISHYPQMRSDFALVDALYNLSLEELKLNTRSDGAFDAGAKWQGVWTRDVSYSILLSLAAIEPGAAQASLLQKVKRDRIVQDTGTGGSWPVSSDRVTWALAAWEIYLVTGEDDWLRESYGIVRNSILDDQEVVIDPATGLARGESTFLDWREQTYPRWMEPTDIYNSADLGTNAVFYRTYLILAAMAKQLGEPAADWNARAERIRSALNERFWQEDRGYYGQYLYGRGSQTLSPRSEALGQAFSILFDIADATRQDRILRSQPMMEFGIPTVYPQTPNVPPYHNRSVWPFVQAYWNLAAAKQENETALLAGLASIYRASALFLTNQENFVLDTGSPVGTEVSSSRQLWSVAGNLAMTYRVFFGMTFAVDGLHLKPVIPEPFRGTRTLTNFRYRQANLTIEVHGFGSRLRAVTVDGETTERAFIPQTLSGDHRIVLEMENEPFARDMLNVVENAVAPETPTVYLREGRLVREPVASAVEYRVYKNGRLVTQIAANEFAPHAETCADFQVSALDSAGMESFLSEPQRLDEEAITIPVTQGEDPDIAISLDEGGHSGLSLEGAVKAAGRYRISFRYANGSGPVNTDNKCAIRTLFVDGKAMGPIVLPQRGQNEWSNWGMSSGQVVSLSAGAHRFELRLTSVDANMNGTINRALISALCLSPAA